MKYGKARRRIQKRAARERKGIMNFKIKAGQVISYKITARTVEGYGRGADERRVIGLGATFDEALHRIKNMAAEIGQTIDASSAAVFEITATGPREVFASSTYFN